MMHHGCALYQPFPDVYCQPFPPLACHLDIFHILPPASSPSCAIIAPSVNLLSVALSLIILYPKYPCSVMCVAT